jgi:hypothetical protein
MMHSPIYSTEGKTTDTVNKYFDINAEILQYIVNDFVKCLEMVPTMHKKHYTLSLQAEVKCYFGCDNWR